MDKLLADEFRNLGGELRMGVRSPSGGVPARPDTLKPELQQEGVVHASGRRVQPVENGWRWFGLKVHARDVPLVADLEMHLGQNGYVGLCRLADGEVNVCGLFRRNHQSNPAGNGFDLLRGGPQSALHQRLARATFDESSFCSVAGLSLQPRRAADKAECCIGDALTMIPPVTGNGMSIAFESAYLAIDPLAAFSRGDCSWSETQGAIARRCDEQFSRRLVWARRLQAALFSPVTQKVLLAMISRSDSFWRFAFGRTR